MCLIIFLLLFMGSVDISYVGASEAIESQLYADLFSNYSTELRPILSSGGDHYKQIVVTGQFGIGQIESLNEKDQQLTVHGYISLSWKDELLTWNHSDYGGATYIIVTANKVWLPEITPINSVLGATEVATLRDDTRVRIFYDGTMIWIPSMKMKTSCAVDVTDFPYDNQVCEISYANWMYTASLLNFTANPTVTIAEISPSGLQWTITDTTAFTSEIIDGDGAGGTVPIMAMQISLKRNPRFFELNVLLPALLLGFLLIPMFMLPVESGEKVSLGVTLMLAYTIFLLMMTDVTPKSGTTPSLTVAILVCTIVNGIAVFISVIIINMHHHSPKTPVPRWMKYAILDKLAHFLCCMKYVDKNEIQPLSSCNSILSTQNEKKRIALGKEFSCHEDISAILKHVEFFKNQKVENDVIEENKENWGQVARVLDRFFLVFFCFFFAGYVLAVLSLKFENE